MVMCCRTWKAGGAVPVQGLTSAARKTKGSECTKTRYCMHEHGQGARLLHGTVLSLRDTSEHSAQLEPSLSCQSQFLSR